MDLNNFFADLFQYGSSWNLILIIIGGCSVVSFGIFLERVFYLKKAEADTHQLIVLLRAAIEEKNMVRAIQVCEEIGGAVASVIKAGLSKHHRGKEQIENALEMAGLVEVAGLERNSKVLSVIAHITPLIGLLGTVVGFIQAFSEMRMSGLVDISATRIGEAMEYALITTAAGLVVAIPSIIAYHYLVSRVEEYVLEMQTTSTEIIDLLTDEQPLGY